jgi:hypothetical protein
VAGDSAAVPEIFYHFFWKIFTPTDSPLLPLLKSINSFLTINTEMPRSTHLDSTFLARMNHKQQQNATEEEKRTKYL